MRRKSAGILAPTTGRTEVVIRHCVVPDQVRGDQDVVCPPRRVVLLVIFAAEYYVWYDAP